MTIGERTLKHGHARKGQRHYLYATWCNAKAVCNNTKHRDYPNFGGRGIKVCDRWKDSFADFLTDLIDAIGHRPQGLSLDRINNDGHYEPGNVRWADWKVQYHNARNVLRSESQSVAAAGVPHSADHNEKMRQGLRAWWTPARRAAHSKTMKQLHA